jgi:uncharacterized protein YhfF
MKSYFQYLKTRKIKVKAFMEMMMSLKDIAGKGHKIYTKIRSAHKEYTESLNYSTEISKNFQLQLQQMQTK